MLDQLCFRLIERHRDCKRWRWSGGLLRFFFSSRFLLFFYNDDNATQTPPPPLLHAPPPSDETKLRGVSLCVPTPSLGLLQQSRGRCPLLPKAPPSVCLHCWREGKRRGGGGGRSSAFCFSPPSGLGGQRTRVAVVVVKQCKGCKNAGSKYRYALLRRRREGRGGGR